MSELSLGQVLPWSSQLGQRGWVTCFLSRSPRGWGQLPLEGTVGMASTVNSFMIRWWWQCLGRSLRRRRWKKWHLGGSRDLAIKKFVCEAFSSQDTPRHSWKIHSQHSALPPHPLQSHNLEKHLPPLSGILGSEGIIIEQMTLKDTMARIWSSIPKLDELFLSLWLCPHPYCSPNCGSSTFIVII